MRLRKNKRPTTSDKQQRERFVNQKNDEIPYYNWFRKEYQHSTDPVTKNINYI